MATDDTNHSNKAEMSGNDFFTLTFP